MPKPPVIKPQVRTLVRREVVVILTRLHLIEYLRSQGIDVPDDAEFTVHVPGGGDWSNTDLNIDGSPINVSYTEVSKE